jgi:hypothetical protein
MAQSNSPARAWEVSTRWCVLGVAPRDRLVESGSLAMCGSWGGSAGQVLHSQGSLGRWGYCADALEGKVATIQCSFRPCPAAALFFWGVGQRAFAERGMGWVCLGTGCLGIGNRGGVSLVGVGPRDRSCTRRDRSGDGAIALTRCKQRLLRSSARSGPVPLLHHFSGALGQRAFAERGMGGIRCPQKPLPP